MSTVIAAIPILIFVLVFVVVMPVQAMTITMANPDATVQRDLIAYWPNGTMYGFYNTTSVINLDTGSDYLFVLKPQYSNPLDEPGVWLASMFSWVTTNIIALIACIFLIGLLLVRR